MITLFIPTRNRAHLLPKAIESVLNQTYTQFSVVISDNASEDSTPQVVESYLKQDNRLSYFRHEKNLGLIGNYNFCLSQASSLFAFLSDDDLLLPHFFEKAIALFQLHPDAGFVALATQILSLDGRYLASPLKGWKQEGRFEKGEAVSEMVGKYPVPTSVLFHPHILKQVKIQEDNPFYWDNAFLLQTAALFPIVISKQTAALFFSHKDSYFHQKTLSDLQMGFEKLEESLAPFGFAKAREKIRKDRKKAEEAFFRFLLLEGKGREVLTLPITSLKTCFYHLLAHLQILYHSRKIKS